MAKLEVDLWPPIARTTSLFDQKIEKHGLGGQIWMVDAAVWATRFFDLKKRKKLRVEALPYPAQFGFELRGCLTKGAEKEKFCANYEIVWCERRDFLTAITRLFDSEKQDFA